MFDNELILSTSPLLDARVYKAEEDLRVWQMKKQYGHLIIGVNVIVFVFNDKQNLISRVKFNIMV